MTITATCSCGAKYRVRPDAAGKKFRCRECDLVFIVEASPEPARPQSRRWAPIEDYDDDFDGDDDGYDEDEPVEQSGRFHSSSERHKILMSACGVSVEAITPKRLQKACDGLLDYLTKSPDVFKQSEVRIDVLSKVKSSKRADVVITMSGTINGRQVRKKIEGSCWGVSNADTLGASQGLAGLLVGTAIDKAMTKRGGPHAGLQREFANVRLGMLEACDKAVGRKASKSTGKWKAIQFGSIIAAIVAFVAFFLFLKMRGDTLGKALTGGLLVVVPAAAIVIGIGMVFMPDSFFMRDAAGRRALKLSGASTPTAARIVGVVTAVLMAGLMAGIVALWTNLK